MDNQKTTRGVGNFYDGIRPAVPRSNGSICLTDTGIHIT